MQEPREISRHLVRFYLIAKKYKGEWRTAKSLSDEACIARRTGRVYSLLFVKLGLFDLAEVYPGHRYKLSDVAENRNRAFMIRLEEAVKVFDSNRIESDYFTLTC